MSNKPISARINEDTFNRLTEICEQKGQTRTQLISNLLDDYVNHTDTENPFNTSTNALNIALFMEQQETIIQNIAKIQSMVEIVKRTNGFLVAGLKFIGKGNKALEIIYSNIKGQ